MAGETLASIAAEYGTSITTVFKLTVGTKRKRLRTRYGPPATPEMIARRMAGETLANIAADYGVSKERIRQRLAAAGITGNRPPPWPAKQDEKLRALWAEGLSSAAIAVRLHTTKAAVTGRVRRMGLPGRRHAKAKVQAPS